MIGAEGGDPAAGSPSDRTIPVGSSASGGPVRVERRLSFTPPLDPSNLFGHLAATAVPGVEEWREGAYRTTLRLPGGPAVVQVGLPAGEALPVVLDLADPADEAEAVRRVRLAFDLDLDPAAMTGALGRDAVLRPLVAAVPGRRVPGVLDPAALLIRAVIGQQVSTAAARTHTARLVAALGEPVADGGGGLGRLFPTPRAIAGAPPELLDAALRMPVVRRRTVLTTAQALEAGRVSFTGPAAEVRAALLALSGIGPWTADTVLMRALGDADAFLPTDLGVVQAARRLGLPDRPRELAARSREWSPYRAHAVQYLWATGTHAVNALPG